MNIVAIGGGSVLMGETASIDRELLRLTGKDAPRLLFIPTASRDERDYIRSIEIAYGRLGASVSTLELWTGDRDPKRAEALIQSADAIYVGGGNTKEMLEVWREVGVDRFLKDHLDAGRPAGGLSAGALCWFRDANSDWPQYEGIPGVNTARLTCLGFVDLALCPHTRDEGFRLDEFETMMREIPGAGVGLDDGAAIQIRGDEYRILASMPGRQAHLMFSVNGKVSRTLMPPHDDFRPLAALRDGVIL